MATLKTDVLAKSLQIRQQINTEFDQLILRINTRRDEILVQLEEVVSHYKHLVKESEQAFIKLEELKLQSGIILNMNLLSGLQCKVSKELDHEIDNMKKEISDLEVSFDWNDDIEEMVPDLGTLNIVGFRHDKPYLANIDYTLKKYPFQTKRVSETEKACCMCIDPITSYIYISYSTGYIYVFNEKADLLLSFGKSELKSPFGICIYKDNLYVVSQSSNLIQKYRLRNDETPKLIRTLDDVNAVLNTPTMLSIDESDGHVYVCDTGNERVVRYNKFLLYKSHICGKGNFSPLNVKLTRDCIILFVKPSATFEQYPIRIYSKGTYILQKCIMIQPEPCDFDLDPSGNLLFSSSNRTEIRIFDTEGTLLDAWTRRLPDPDNFRYGPNSVKCFAINRGTGNIILLGWDKLVIYL
ncbi:Outer membrane phospholipase A [Oopsacas minuta]|uniref:Outer membrane phospholipase A n=1 Tax=Oopsacas minuta TaxID=111878 RepID=A0AAV7KCZ8_9METZ|nr:Outer membrane phospholipase A [Oopsacas minuta]